MNLYCANPVLDIEVRRQLGEAISAQINGGEAQEISANPLPDLKTCKILTDYGQGEMVDEDLVIPCDNVTRASRYLASDKRKIIDRHRGRLECDIAYGGRYSAILPPGARAPGCTIRIHRYRRIPLNAYMTAREVEALTMAISRRANIIFAGPMFGGKTTLLRAALELCVEKIAPHERYALLEDTVELRVEAKNLISLLAGREGDDNHASYQDHIRGLMRQRVERFVVGEIRGDEALDLIEVWNKGITGNFTTIHANSARDVPTALEILIERAGGNAQRVQERIARVLGLIVYVRQLSGGKRRVTEMLKVGWSNDGYEFTEVGK
jgi:Flp pilus assembly CpaF family ATPase